ncbi:DUF523 domain-containing protein [Gynuella sp.]|uniref:DUF523 domain-containing protein n=1 Tax=Gynuella sp. TaxID=2969146 RepID=UPI003D108E3C
MKVLISACLLGEPVRYDGKGKPVTSPILQQWQQSGQLLPFCPELAGGLPVPREPAEIQPDHRIVTHSQLDVTGAFELGARQAQKLVQDHGIKIAIMTDLSPSCGSTHIYDGSFGGRVVEGEGRTVQYLRQAGVRVFSQHQIDQAWQYWQKQVTGCDKGL